MPDTAISGLTAIVSVAGGDELAVADASDLTVSKKATATQIATFTTPASSDTVAGSIQISLQSEQEAGNATTKAVTPGRQHFHPSAAKFWVNAVGGSTTILASYNMTSWANTGTGDADGTIATDFSGTGWFGCVSILDSTLAWNAQYTEFCGFNVHAAGTFGVLCARMEDGNNAVATVQNPEQWFVCGFGDQ
jgi:hypothetical protein